MRRRPPATGTVAGMDPGAAEAAVYEIRVVGEVDDAALDAFRDLEVDVLTDDRVTILHGALDQAGLQGILDRVRALHLRLEDVRRLVAETSSGDDSHLAAGSPRSGAWTLG